MGAMKSPRKPTRHAPTKYKVAQEIVASVAGVVSVTYNIATKPPSTIEAV